eukprot:TRINITY_DN5537_c0_g4_i1.p1 TRINITY_DN5537_c0_g4~~TRINITY_DN5537_c0_g4_i1.p1  ORF type:complete len:662 (+),score=94.37 TRINITY_DN5537_c0_g4_i1:82-2067(+)
MESSVDGAAFTTLYPMYVLPVNVLMQLPRLHVHSDMIAQGLLQEMTEHMKGKVIVISHQWLSYDSPDPNNEHLLTLQRMIGRLMNGEVSRVEDYWLHSMMFLSKGITASKWQDSLPNMYIWIDYCCIPQVSVSTDDASIAAASKAVQSIPAYVERCDLLLVLAPVCTHQDTGKACNFATWRSRGWCRTELMCAVLAPNRIRVMVCTGSEATPFLLHPFEGPRLPVGDGHFSCCSLGHRFHGKELACDKERVRSILTVMLQAKIQRLGAAGLTSERHWFTSMSQAFLQDLSAPSSDRCDRVLESANSRKELSRSRSSHSRGCSELRRVLKWTPADDAHSLKTGFTLMMCAALADDFYAVQELGNSDRGLINLGLKRHFYQLAFMWKGVRPLGAAMAMSSWLTVQALLNAKADPTAQAANGMDALFFACCKGNLENIRCWLSRFPSWNLERTIPIMGMNPLCAAAISGARKEPVIRCLIKAKAVLEERRQWGGESALLCLIANNEDSQKEAMQLLLDHGCSVNASWTPHTCFFKCMLKLVRLGGKLTSSRPVAELSLLEGSTPLHFAAKRGDVAMVRQLIAAKADVEKRNSQGRRPIDVAEAFFGGQVPLPLSRALVAEQDDDLAGTVPEQDRQSTCRFHTSTDVTSKVPLIADRRPSTIISL